MRGVILPLLMALCVIIFIELFTISCWGAERVGLQITGTEETVSPIPLGIKAQLYLRLARRIFHAPKILYKVEKIEVYKDGVWAEYSVTNLNLERKYITPSRLGSPIGYMRALDSDGRTWRIPQFEGCVTFRNPDLFISIEPDSSKRFRSKVSFMVSKPPELVKPIPGQVGLRPSKFTYLITDWINVYTELSEQRQQYVPAFAFGSGTVPVKWIDKNSPEFWRSTVLIED